MSAAPPPEVLASGPGSVTGTGNLSEGCPLCGGPLAAEQEWCLRCGAAARTRLAAAPSWRAPLVAAAVLLALAVGVLAAALVKLAADSGPAPPAATRTVTAAAAPSPAATRPAATTAGATPPASSLPASAPTVAISAPATTPKGGTAGGVSPGK